jgi:hypothetical protein
MAPSRRWLRTDEYVNAEGALRKALQTMPLVRKDVLEWKWLLESLHAGAQGIFVLALSRGNDLLTLKSSHAAAWLKAYESNGPWPKKLDLDYFLELYAKVKKHVLRGTAFTVTPAHDDAMDKLNNLRNGFVHFGAHGWSIELAGLPSICLRALDVTDAVTGAPGVIHWRSVAQSRRVRQTSRSIAKGLNALAKAYAT